MALLCLATGQAAWAQQTDNVYRSKYTPKTVYHWTDSLRWTNTLDVTTLGAVPNDNQSDQAAIEAAINQLNAQGGGVVWFPAGVYDLTDDLKLKSGVILRGVTPTVTDAKDQAFLPPSKLNFPKYDLGDTTTGGNPVNGAFKEIKNDEGNTSNIGLVWLDINRATVGIHPNFDSLGMVTHDGGTNANWQAREFNRNCIIFGVRSNNTAIADPGVPTGQQRPYQRFQWRFTSNFDLFFGANCVVANCRLNDNCDDAFQVPGWRGSNGRLLAINGGNYDFNYTDHYGITLNRAKIRIANGVKKIEPFIWYPGPEQEPSLFRKGMEVRDNWVYKTMRVGIIAAGMGLVIDGNIVRDKDNKETAITPNGQSILTNYSATLENRGIDYSGWDVTLTRNDVMVRNHDFPPSQYNSVDGEGIMNQGNSGGSLVDGIVAKYNIVNSNVDRGTNPGIACYRTKDINNVLVDSNTFTGSNGYIYIVADRPPANTYQLNNVIITNNIDAKNIQALGTVGGINCRVENNATTRAAAEIRASCHVLLNNNTGYASVIGCTGTRGEDPNYPKGYLTGPLRDTTIGAANLTPTLDFTGEVYAGTIDSVTLWQDTKRLAVTTVNGSSFTFSIPTQGLKTDQEYSFKARLYAGTMQSSTQIVRVTILSDPVGIPNNQTASPKLLAYPNPTNHLLYLDLPAIANQVEVRNLQGHLVQTTSNSNRIDLQRLSPGVYLVAAKVGGQVLRTKVVKI